MNLWDRFEFPEQSNTVLQLQHQGEDVEIEMEETIGTHSQLTWVNLDEEQVDQLMAWLQEWKNARAKVAEARQSPTEASFP